MRTARSELCACLDIGGDKSFRIEGKAHGQGIDRNDPRADLVTVSLIIVSRDFMSGGEKAGGQVGVERVIEVAEDDGAVVVIGRMVMMRHCVVNLDEHQAENHQPSSDPLHRAADATPRPKEQNYAKK